LPTGDGLLTLGSLEPPAPKGAISRAVSFFRPYALGVAGSAYLFTVGWIKPKNRAAIVELVHHFGYYHESREPAELPEIGISEVAPADHPIDLRAIESVDGNVTDRELVNICRIVKNLEPARVFEFGTFDGRTTLNMAVNAGTDATIYTLDLPRSSIEDVLKPIHRDEVAYAAKAESGERYRGTDAEDRIVQLYGDSGSFDFTPYYGNIDLAFIDASHTFDYVVNDSLHALRMVQSSGGTIIWHDYGRWDGVTGALNQLQRKHPSFAGLKRISGDTLAILRV
jgi:predicted O-methyltransferase YrrM